MYSMIVTICTLPLVSPMARDCKEWYEAGVNKSGVYPINPDNGTPFQVSQLYIVLKYTSSSSSSSLQVYCDMVTNGGGWTVFQRRQDGSVNFYRNWVDYENGFGNLTGEFWLGLSKIHRLTPNGANTLRVDLGDFSNNYRHAQYKVFEILDSSVQYALVIGGYSGNANNSLIYHNNMKFTTKDRDNDAYSAANCAVPSTGAWWYNNCHTCNLNGLYVQGGTPANGHNVLWGDWKGSNYSLRFTEMKVRRN